MNVEKLQEAIENAERIYRVNKENQEENIKAGGPAEALAWDAGLIAGLKQAMEIQEAE